MAARWLIDRLRPFSAIAFLITAWPMGSAHADCPSFPAATQTIQIRSSHAPVTDASGEVYPGCIAQLADGSTGYIAYESACRRKAPFTQEMVVERGCCDTGPDHGDLSCVVRVNGNGTSMVVRAKGITWRPTLVDEGAIDDLVKGLSGSQMGSVHSAAMRLAEHLGNPKLQPLVATHKAAIQASFENGSPQAQVLAAYLLLELELAPDKRAGYAKRILQDRFGQATLVNAALNAAGQLRSEKDALIPALQSFAADDTQREALREQARKVLRKLSRP